MSSPEAKPYVMSEDLGILMKGWEEVTGNKVPPVSYFASLTDKLRHDIECSIDEKVVVVSSSELTEGLTEEVSKDKNPIVSLDRAYVDNALSSIVGNIDSTRGVNEKLEKLGELIPRPGYLPLDLQYEELRSDKVSPITLVDDVIYDGDTALGISERLAKVNRPVERVIAGIAIGDGVKKLEKAGIEVVCVRFFSDVIDEVCERDFFAGATMSGRTVIHEDGSTWSVPYFSPFGKPEEWASIPLQSAERFSQYCLENSIDMWSKVKNEQGLSVLARDIPRRIHKLQQDRAIVDTLTDHLEGVVEWQ